MSSSEGTYSRLVSVASEKEHPAPKASSRPEARPAKRPPDEAREDLSTTPYISQNYRFTEDELRWLRRHAYSLTERLGTKVSQNTILRVALRLLRETCTRNPKRNPLTDALSQIKK